ncbi:MAG: DUF4238 domain-containing protein [Solirubrobacteraceae bacterium]
MGRFDHVAAAIEDSPVAAEFKEMAISHDFSRLDNNSAKRHHFVPQLLLRRFSHKHNKKDCIFQMETTSRKAPRRVPVRTAASRHQLYRAIDKDGKSSNRHEGYLALVEEHAAPALRAMDEHPKSITRGDRATIAFFVALQTMRTPAAADQVTAIANAAMHTWASEFYSDRQAFTEHYRRVHEPGASEMEIEQLRQNIINQIRDGKIRLNGDAGAAFATAFEYAIGNVPILIEFDWTLLKAPNGGFITSDRGYAIHDPFPPYPWAAQGILSSERSETTIPLSDTTCLLMRPMPMGGAMNVREVSSREVERINLRTYGWARSHVFARSQITLDAVRVASRRQPANVIRPKPFSQVFLLDPDPDDKSLGNENLRRGWPPMLPNDKGEPRDYIVIPVDKPHPELWKRANELTERRARKRAGVGPDDVLEGHIINIPLHPLDVRH